MEYLPKLQQVWGEEIENLILKFLWKFRGSARSAKIILTKWKRVEELTLHDFKTCYKPNNQDSMLLHRNRNRSLHIAQVNGTEGRVQK